MVRRICLLFAIYHVTKEPTNLVDSLVSMGFPNRHLNEELLKKHNNHIRAVVNDLLNCQS